MTQTNLPAPITPSGLLLTAVEFRRLADVPPEIEWFANLANKSTRRAYENALQDFMRFTGIARPEEFRTVTRAHVIAWRDDLVCRVLSGMTIRHRLAALSSLFEYLCEKTPERAVFSGIACVNLRLAGGRLYATSRSKTSALDVRV